jgi:hypothetical protein
MLMRFFLSRFMRTDTVLSLYQQTIIGCQKEKQFIMLNMFLVFDQSLHLVPIMLLEFLLSTFQSEKI